MKYTLTILIMLVLSTAVVQAQAGRGTEADMQGESITQRQVRDLPLPKRGYRPKLILQKALKAAEEYVARERIDIAPYYLAEARFIMYGSGEAREPAWYFWWINESGAMGDYVEIIVSVETGKARRLPSM